jgi:hypothetical protein
MQEIQKYCDNNLAVVKDTVRKYSLFLSNKKLRRKSKKRISTEYDILSDDIKRWSPESKPTANYNNKKNKSMLTAFNITEILEKRKEREEKYSFAMERKAKPYLKRDIRLNLMTPPFPKLAKTRNILDKLQSIISDEGPKVEKLEILSEKSQRKDTKISIKNKDIKFKKHLDVKRWSENKMRSTIEGISSTITSPSRRNISEISSVLHKDKLLTPEGSLLNDTNKKKIVIGLNTLF